MLRRFHWLWHRERKVTEICQVTVQLPSEWKYSQLDQRCVYQM
jgi:hypothetical protein